MARSPKSPTASASSKAPRSPKAASKGAQPAADGRWLSIVGIGEDGPDGLSPAARAQIEGAQIVFGGARHLALAQALIRGEAHAWPSPFAIDPVLAARGRAVCVLASGDPMLHGVGAVLARHVPADEMRVVPGPSAFALAAARLGWPLQETAQVSLHGREIGRLRPFLQPGARILALTSDEHGPAAVARLLAEYGCGASRLTVLEALGGPRERIRAARADGFDLVGIQPLNLVAIEIEMAEGAPVLTLANGLPDELFEHDGQITKREIRALTLSALAPRRGELLWDIGGGSGSVSIEWLLSDPSLSAIAIEKDATRAARMARNAERLGVPHLQIVEGAAPKALAGLPPPDVIFVGGGASRTRLLDTALEALKPGGRLVANAVTLQTEALLLAAHARLGGDLVRIALSRAAPVQGLTGWRSAMPVTQWRHVKAKA
ncbi:precorrin-6y C5,15-methyltransferase (decarboxylating) subunit CbiE [Xanthobacter tagetidis]|uniref:Precorrin-6y C5,15-methyltransferase (Decarboxylating) subunit CbiE n=1 Tax=Xanthobacter tagetidis TaxID=60216 RepID=A0A3L7AQ01_9HYPH|nr:precorrin-6y C5,15-methyltransferase (decarboxylating) subunit CbiE [Xanthobacter tagetidis]MBB6307851.1 precorrin-6Y C5,15-methyltransferase (decarboxylating) [Xanthobacter tagetidis]RLP81512.1 precorrin-6y C5,15-methyltransferase (decarboxylating) subunit CbiE [Xanthobacter tagetidis]